MKSWLAAIALVVACAMPALAADEANHLGTARGAAPLVRTAVATEAFADEDLIVTGVTGKRIAVLGFSLSNTAAVAGVLSFNCGVAGTTMWSAQVASGIGVFMQESAEAGGFVFRCASGVGVSVANTQVGSGSIKINLRYVLED